MPFEIRLLRDNEYSQVVNFYNNAQNIGRKSLTGTRTLERFKWEFIDCPDGKAIYAVAVENDGATEKIVGVQCAIPFKFISSNNEVILTAKGEDSLIDISLFRKYRNRDILKEMYNFLFEECKKLDIKLIWGFNNIPSTLKRIGFDVPFFAKNAVLVINPFKAYPYLVSLNPNNTKKEKFKIAGLSIISAIHGCKRFFISGFSHKYKCIDRITDNTPLFSEGIHADKNYFNLIQNDKFTQWRIYDNPSQVTYKIKQFFSEDNKLVAEIIFSYYDGLAYIEQMLFNKNLSINTKKKFMKEIIRELVSQKSFIIRFTGFENNNMGKEEILFMKKIGFIFAKRGAAFVIKPLVEGKPILPEEFLLSRLYFQSF